MRSSMQDLIPYNPGITKKQLEEKLGRKIIKLSANESIWGPSPAIKEFLPEYITKFNLYPDGAGKDLKEALNSTWHLSQENFCLGNGTDEIIALLVSAFLNPGDEVVIPIPTFSSYAISTTIVGGKIIFVPQKRLTFNLKEIIRFIQPAVKIIFLCNPNNPTGTFFNQAELEFFLENISKDILVVLDEAYCHYATDSSFPNSRKLLEKYPNLVVLRTFSKVYGLAALRIGYAVATTQIINKMEKIRQPYNVNTIAQIAAIIALQEEKYLQKVVTETVREREWLTLQLRQRGLTVLPSQANFLLMQINNASLVSGKILQEGVLIRNATSFGLPDWLRITVAPHQYMEQFLECLDKVLRAI